MAEEPSKSQSEIILSRRIFFAGCLGLPWLWICNVMYFRKQVFGPCVFFDYWPGRRCDYLDAVQNDETNDANSENSVTNNEKMELEKWVKRSTRGAILVCCVFVAWIVVFQVNKENFGSGWFVMDMTEEESSGW